MRWPIEMNAYGRRVCEMAAYERHAYEMAYGRCTPMRDKPTRWPVGDTRLWERHVHEMAYGRGTPMRSPVRGMPMRDMPIKCPSIGDVYLGSTFNQSVRITFTT
jgi:hypothetical protein